MQSKFSCFTALAMRIPSPDRYLDMVRVSSSAPQTLPDPYVFPKSMFSTFQGILTILEMGKKLHSTHTCLLLLHVQNHPLAWVWSGAFPGAVWKLSLFGLKKTRVICLHQVPLAPGAPSHGTKPRWISAMPLNAMEISPLHSRANHLHTSN